MKNDFIYPEYLNSLQVKFATGHKYNATNIWNNTETLVKLNKFYYVTDGEFLLTVKNKDYIVKKGQLAMIPANTKHSYKLTEKGKMQKYWCHFEASVGMANLFDIINTDLIVDIGIDKSFIALFKKMYIAAESNTPASCITEKAMLMLIISGYLEKCKSITPRKAHSATELTPVIQYMKDHVNQSININELSEIVHLHPNYFIRLFKQYFGAPPLKYFNMMKIDEAKKLLQKGNLSIETVAKETGFADVYSFSKFFKNNVGISPSRFKPNQLDS